MFYIFLVSLNRIDYRRCPQLRDSEFCENLTGVLGHKLTSVVTSHIYLSVLGEICFKIPVETTGEHVWVLQNLAQGRV